jgi:DNA-binding NarL/FixJ family response regulator
MRSDVNKNGEARERIISDTRKAIIKLIESGYRTSQVAQRLQISQSTIS